MGAVSLVQMSPAQEDDGPAISQRTSEETIVAMTHSQTMNSKESDCSFMILCAVQSTPQLEQPPAHKSTRERTAFDSRKFDAMTAAGAREHVKGEARCGKS